MNPWTDLLQKPARLTDRTAANWFAGIADHLLNRTRLVIAGISHRLIEIEFYYRGPGHEDPFTHGDPIQSNRGRWYFHKTAGAYRGGSFKGIDVTFGEGPGRGGILFRGMENPDGTIIDGPSLLVDRLLRLCGKTTVAELDEAIGGRFVWDPTSPLYFDEGPNLGKAILACARVGLSLRRACTGSTMPKFLTRPYRFLTEPTRTAKGKVQMVLGLHRLAQPMDAIRRVTGCPNRAIAGYIAEYGAGLREGQFGDYFGKELSATDICRLHGIADRK
jgi:hypothetical protein